jgi:hypothetical protein
MRPAGTVVGILIALFSATPAIAYVGPGAGIGALGAIIGIIAALFMSVFVIALWPIRKMLRRRRGTAQLSGETDT